VDLSTQRPDSGTYDWVDGMGLVESMTRQQTNLGDIAKDISARDSIFMEVVAETNGETQRATVERRFMSPEVHTERVSTPFTGELFFTDQAHNPTVIVPTGSGGDLGSTLPIAALLASHGLNALALAYFHEQGLPSNLARIPLEYFEGVFAWLANHPLVNGKKLQILGISKGGELALLLASRYPVITRVVGMAPHAYCFQGLNFRNMSSWTYHGEDLPFIQLKDRWVFADMLSGFLHDRPFEFAPTYVRGLHSARNTEAARIKVENAQADLLLLAGRQDGMWNAYDGCVRIMEELTKRDYPHQFSFQAYDGAGHQWYPAYIVPCTETTSRMGPRLVLSTGGALEANARAVADGWERALAFFQR